MNPYASFLGDRNARAAIGETAASLRATFAKLDASAATRKPAPNRWSPAEILFHLADTEMVFAFRLRQALSENDHVIQPVDQDGWAASYGAYSVDEALALFSAVRAWNIRLIDSLPPEAFDRALSHPERGPMLLRTVVETMGGHDRNHLAQLAALAA